MVVSAGFLTTQPTSYLLMDLVGHYSFSNLPSAEPFCVKEFIVTSNQFLTPLVVCRPNRLFSLKAKVGEKTTFELYFNIFWATGARQFNYDMWNMRILNMYCYYFESQLLKLLLMSIEFQDLLQIASYFGPPTQLLNI